MKEIKKFVSKSLKDVPRTRTKKDLIENLTNNLIEKYDDLIDQGFETEVALQKVMDEFGSVDDVVNDYELTLNTSLRKIKARNRLIYAIFGFLMITGVSIFANVYFTPQIVWCVFIGFGVMWWPLTMMYIYLNVRSE